MNRYLKKVLILLAWIILWQIAAVVVDNPVYFASVPDTISQLFAMALDTQFWISVLGSLGRILSGLLAASLLGYVCGALSYISESVRCFLEPPVSFLKSVPVAAITVILLIWWGPPYLVLCICMMVVFPNIYMNMLAGLNSADKRLLEMADVFGMRPKEKLLWIFRPAYLEYLHPAISVSVGMGFKSAVAAEVIGLPELSIGEQLYRDKIYLNTPGVFAWVIVILALGALTERAVIFVLRRLSHIPAPCPKALGPIRQSDGAGEPPADKYTVVAKGLVKSFGQRCVVDTGVRLERGVNYIVAAPSGSGKTTFLHILAHLLQPDSGSVDTAAVSMVFQDDRLIEHANALRNLQIAGCRGDLAKEISSLYAHDHTGIPASKMSGGERRRLAVARAVLADSDVIIMDEPFAGMDENTMDITIQWILAHTDGRTLLISTHDAGIASRMNARLISHNVHNDKGQERDR